MTGEALLANSNGEWLPLAHWALFQSRPFASKSHPKLRRPIAQHALAEQNIRSWSSK